MLCIRSQCFFDRSPMLKTDRLRFRPGIFRILPTARMFTSTNFISVPLNSPWFRTGSLYHMINNKKYRSYSNISHSHILGKKENKTGMCRKVFDANTNLKRAHKSYLIVYKVLKTTDIRNKMGQMIKYDLR